MRRPPHTLRSSSFQFSTAGLAVILGFLFASVVTRTLGSTVVGITPNGQWTLNGNVTYPGTPAEGLLMNIRMVNATFEDARPVSAWPQQLPASFDPDENTAAFIARIPEYKAHGVRAFTLSLQGGSPKYEGAHNSAFNADGTLRADYMKRVQRVIEACDAHGMAVILGCLYQRQHGAEPTRLPRALQDRAAIRAAVRHTAEWIRERDYRHVVLEVANEYAHSGYARWADGAWLRTAEAQVELIGVAREAHPRLLVATSGMGHGRMPAAIGEASDFVLIHFNNTPLDAIAARIADARTAHPNKPIIVNEDDKTGADGAEAARLSVAHGASWGYMGAAVNQSAPFQFRGAADDPPVYAMLARLTGNTSARTASGTPHLGTQGQSLITEPGDGGTFRPGADIRVKFVARPADGATLRSLRLFANGKVIGEPAATQTEYVWGAVPAGVYNLQLRVTDSNGRETDSRLVDIYVQ